MKLKERIGKFRIPISMIEEQPYKVQLIMAWMIILRAECRFEMDSIEYIAISPLFPCRHCEGTEPLIYEIEVTRSNQVIAHNPFFHKRFMQDPFPTHETDPVLKSDVDQELEEFLKNPLGKEALDEAGKIIDDDFISKKCVHFRSGKPITTWSKDQDKLRWPHQEIPKHSPISPGEERCREKFPLMKMNFGKEDPKLELSIKEMSKKIVKGFAIPKHMLSKRGFPTFMEPVNAEEMFPKLSFKENFNRFLAHKRQMNRFSNCAGSQFSGILGPNEWAQEDGKIIKECPKCYYQHTDRTVSHCEECGEKF